MHIFGNPSDFIIFEDCKAKYYQNFFETAKILRFTDNVSVEDIIGTFVLDFSEFMRSITWVPDNQNVLITEVIGTFR